MEKFVHVDEKNKVCVVVLKNEWKQTVAKGIARCSEDDEFNTEAGVTLANARAWDKYFDLAIKEETEGIQVCESLINTWTEAADKHRRNIEALQEKSTTIKKELEDLLSTL